MLDFLGSFGALAGPASVIVGAVLLAVLVPRTAISVGCGALFGTIAGAGYALAAAMLAAVATYVIGRLAGRDWVARRAGDRLARIDTWLARRGLVAVIIVRMLPLAPYGLIGYAYGTTSVRRSHYHLGTLIGAAPSAATYAAIGAAAVAPGQVRLVSFIPAVIGVGVSGAAALYWRRQARMTAPA